MFKKCWQWINLPFGKNSFEGEQDHVWWNGFLSFSLLLLVQYFWLILAGIYPIDLLHVQGLMGLEIFGSMDALVEPIYRSWSVVWYVIFIVLISNITVHRLMLYQVRVGILDLTFLSKEETLDAEHVWLSIWWLVPSYSFSLVLVSFILMLATNWCFNGRGVESKTDNFLKTGKETCSFEDVTRRVINNE